MDEPRRGQSPGEPAKQEQTKRVPIEVDSHRESSDEDESEELDTPGRGTQTEMRTGPPPLITEDESSDEDKTEELDTMGRGTQTEMRTGPPPLIRGQGTENLINIDCLTHGVESEPRHPELRVHQSERIST